MAVAHNRYKFVTVPIPKRLRNGRFTSETAARRFQKRNHHLDQEVLKKIRWGGWFCKAGKGLWLGWAYLTKTVRKAATARRG
jgi:hypothetical protein